MTLHATSDCRFDFPDDLFFDKRLVQHGQHFGRPGHIAFATTVAINKDLYVLEQVSDVVQGHWRSAEFGSQLHSRFRGWPQMLANGLLDFAVNRNFRRIVFWTPQVGSYYALPMESATHNTSERAMEVSLLKHFEAEKRDGWWLLDVRRNAHKVVPTESEMATDETRKSICVVHDIEGGLGHVAEDPELALHANERIAETLDQMLNIEARLSCKATYNVVGKLLPDLREKIESNGHCLAFHSYDHQIPGCGRWMHKLWRHSAEFAAVFKGRLGLEAKLPRAFQLEMCRRLDPSIRGYRPPQSLMTAELTDENLCLYGFDWIASGQKSLGIDRPLLRSGLAKIPMQFDDFDLYCGMRYEVWERRALDVIAANDFIAFALHDCYAEYWLPFYADFLERILSMGTACTIDEVADSVFLAASV